MTVSVAVSEIFNVKEWCDLENRVRVRSRSLEMAPFETNYGDILYSLRLNGRKSRNVYTPPVFSVPAGGEWPHRNFITMIDAGRMIGLPYGEKNYDDMLSSFHIVPERNGRTDRQTDGRTDGRTDLPYQYRASVCWRAIKKLLGHVETVFLQHFLLFIQGIITGPPSFNWHNLVNMQFICIKNSNNEAEGICKPKIFFIWLNILY